MSDPKKPNPSTPSVAKDTVAAEVTPAQPTGSSVKDTVIESNSESEAVVEAPVFNVADEAEAPAQERSSQMEPEAIARYDTNATTHRISADLRGRTKSQAEFNKLSRRSLLTGAVGAVAAFDGWRTLQGRPESGNIPYVLRTGHEVNENIWRTLFRSGAEAPTFDYAESSMMRVNGRHGIRDDLDLANWELRVLGRNGEELGTHQLADLRALPQTEMTVEHKCVEGWSHIVTWGGVVFSEFLEAFYPEQADAKFVGLSTPDGVYNVGLDMDSMMHPQTMLSLDLQREPLTEGHGAPVRLSTPLKYGTKQIKRIGTIQFSDTQPENDYWTVRGYDWYAGL